MNPLRPERWRLGGCLARWPSYPQAGAAGLLQSAQSVPDTRDCCNIHFKGDLTLQPSLPHGAGRIDSVSNMHAGCWYNASHGARPHLLLRWSQACKRLRSCLRNISFAAGVRLGLTVSDTSQRRKSRDWNTRHAWLAAQTRTAAPVLQENTTSGGTHAIGLVGIE